MNGSELLVPYIAESRRKALRARRQTRQAMAAARQQGSPIEYQVYEEPVLPVLRGYPYRKP